MATGRPASRHSDISMPGRDGIEATRRIAAATPHIGVAMLTMFEGDDSVFAALRAGARGYVLKGAPRAQIVREVRLAAEGEAVILHGCLKQAPWTTRPKPGTTTMKKILRLPLDN